MNALHDYVDEAPPRSDATVASILGPLQKQARRLARSLGLGFIIVMVVVGALAFAAELTSESPELKDAVVLSTTGLVFMGLLPAWAIRRVILRDVIPATRVVREGTLVRAHIIKLERFPLGGLHMFEIGWSEGNGVEVAHIEVDKYARPLANGEEFAVFAIPLEKRIVAVFGDNGVFVGVRKRLKRG